MNQQNDRPETGYTPRSLLVRTGYGFVGLILFGVFVLWLLYQGVRALLE
jgi:hypothetical protein